MSGGGKGGSTTSEVKIPKWLEDAARSNLASSASAGTSLLWPAATFAMMSARPATAESFFLVDRVRAATGTSSLATV